MIYEKKVFSHNIEMTEQTRVMVDFLFGTKRNIESCPFATQDEKDAEIYRREMLLNTLKPLMGL